MQACEVGYPMREEFLSSPDVSEFVSWLSAHVASLPVRLELPHSPYVPAGLVAETHFAAIVPRHYRWRLAGMSTGDWYETTQCVHALALPLRDAVVRNDAAAARRACEAIAQWGADRNSRVGASAFLNGLKDSLPGYLKHARMALRLSVMEPNGDYGALLRMNSTLCKIHALLARDGLPIYESRVAVAAATLVELWRRDTGRAQQPLPAALCFPAVGSQAHRRIRHVFPDAADPGVLGYVQGSESATAARWADAAVRLGVIIEATLQQCDPRLFVSSASSPTGAMSGRKAAFIGALFMAGYEPACLRPGDVRVRQQELAAHDGR